MALRLRGSDGRAYGVKGLLCSRILIRTSRHSSLGRLKISVRVLAEFT